MGLGGPVAGRHLAGGAVFDEPPFRAVAPNITPDSETGIDRWTDAQLARTIRAGKRPGGSTIGPPMPMGLYRGLSDADLAVMAAYRRSVSPLRNAAERCVDRIPLLEAYGPARHLRAAVGGQPGGGGAYLANAVARCTECHTPMVRL